MSFQRSDTGRAEDNTERGEDAAKVRARVNNGLTAGYKIPVPPGPR